MEVGQSRMGKHIFLNFFISGTPKMKIMEMKKQFSNNNITINAIRQPGDPCITMVINRSTGFLLPVDHILNR